MSVNNALGTDIDPEYIECHFDGYVHDTMADYSTFHGATGWEPEIGFEEGVELVCEPYSEDAPEEAWLPPSGEEWIHRPTGAPLDPTGLPRRPRSGT